MLILLASSASFLFTCNQADQIILNVYQNDYLTNEDQIGIIESVLESTPPECSAHYHNEWTPICN